MSNVVGIDLSLACATEPRGIGVFEKNIGLPSEDFLKANKVYVFGVGRRPSWIVSNVTYINLYTTNPIIREQIYLPMMAFFLNINHLHVFANVVPVLIKLKYNCKVYLTIHDVSYKYTREYMSNDKNQNTFKRHIGLLYQSVLFDYSCKIAHKIHTVSDWSSSEIIKMAKHTVKDKLSVIRNVCAQDFVALDKREWHLREERIILVTGSHPQKNLIFFLDCFLELINEIHPNIVVDIVGVNKAELESKYIDVDRIEFHGKVTQSELLSLYDNSKILVMPSLFESFSIPLLEAKYRGLHILSSNGGATKEVAANYALFFDPTDKQDFKTKLVRLLMSSNVAPNYELTEQIDINSLYWG